MRIAIQLFLVAFLLGAPGCAHRDVTQWQYELERYKRGAKPAELNTSDERNIGPGIQEGIETAVFLTLLLGIAALGG
ncbi:MAG: hypothetical protein AAGD14_18430 [Planctomycetota bacterium]